MSMKYAVKLAPSNRYIILVEKSVVYSQIMINGTYYTHIVVDVVTLVI